jgi:hypothetical protein
MNNLISVEEFIEEAKKRSVDFGKGDPYNRLRYYTKIGWLPHMIRKKNDEGEITGHYPSWALDQLILIETLKNKGTSNEEIAKKVQLKSKLQNLVNAFTSKETRTQFISYATLFILLIILASETGFITIGKSKSTLLPYNNNAQMPVQVVDSGTAFIPRYQNKVFIKDPLVKQTSKVYVTFDQDYTPATRYWVQEIKDYEGFMVQLDAPAAENAEFNWWVTN